MFIQNWFQQKDKKIKIGFEDVLYALQNPDKHILINTLSKDNQHCLIKNT